MKRILSWMVIGITPLLCPAAVKAALPPATYATPPETASFLKAVLSIAEHNDLSDVAFSQTVFGPNLTVDSDAQKTMHSASGLNLGGQGPGMQATGSFDYYYTLVPPKSRLQFWKTADPLFVAEIGFDHIADYRCINGQDISGIFHTDQNVGLLSTRSHTFRVSQGPNMVTEIEVDGPVEGDEGGCVNGLTIQQHHITEFVPAGGIGGGPAEAK